MGCRLQKCWRDALGAFCLQVSGSVAQPCGSVGEAVSITCALPTLLSTSSLRRPSFTCASGVSVRGTAANMRDTVGSATPETAELKLRAPASDPRQSQIYLTELDKVGLCQVVARVGFQVRIGNVTWRAANHAIKTTVALKWLKELQDAGCEPAGSVLGALPACLTIKIHQQPTVALSYLRCK